MIEIIITVDYEIYGNGLGSLRELVYEPTERIRAVLRKWRAPGVVFVEAAELEMIGARGTDADIGRVERQVREIRADGSEIGLHLHPQWYRGRYEGSRWELDFDEYNLGRLPSDRIEVMLGRSIAYLRRVLTDPAFIPVSYRAGNWLLQPTEAAAAALAHHGIKVDSSVFKGGLQRTLGLDYRPALRNGYYWTFSRDVNVPDPRGALLEIPTFTRVVPVWKMFTAKRVGLARRAPAGPGGRGRRWARLRDFARLAYPQKLDFCRLSARDLIGMFDRELKRDRSGPESYRPIVAIGHTKDLADLEGLDSFLAYLRAEGVPVSTLGEAYRKIAGISGAPGEAPARFKSGEGRG